MNGWRENFTDTQSISTNFNVHVHCVTVHHIHVKKIGNYSKCTLSKLEKLCYTRLNTSLSVLELQGVMRAKAGIWISPTGLRYPWHYFGWVYPSLDDFIPGCEPVAAIGSFPVNFLNVYILKVYIYTRKKIGWVVIFYWPERSNQMMIS